MNTARATSELACTQLILAGPDPSGVHDDPEAEEVLKDLCGRVSSLEPHISRRIHLVRLPMMDGRQNALMVNALQRVATVIAQMFRSKARRISVWTANEAMWKIVPLVASGIGWLELQIRPRGRRIAGQRSNKH